MSLQTPMVSEEVEQCTLQDVLRVDTPGPEEEAIVVDVAERTQRTIAWLKPNYQVVCYSLMSGSTRTAAMETIGTTKQAWSYYRRNLQDAFGIHDVELRTSERGAPTYPGGSRAIGVGFRLTFEGERGRAIRSGP